MGKAHIIHRTVETCAKFCSENQKHRDHLEDLEVDERILKCILKNWVAE
jgi:hypothetical protein